nr:hypothetical protein [Clostridia bacterium]
MLLNSLEHEFIAACCEVPPNFEKAKALLAAGVDINGKDDQGELLVSRMVLGFPQESPRCINCKAETCVDCPQDDVTYLPKVIEFLVSNGWNSKETGCEVLSSLVFSTYSKEMFEAAKIICQAGFNTDQAYVEDALESIGTEESYQRCEGNHDMENLFYTFYEVVERASKNQPFEHIDTYHSAIGLKIDKIVVFGEDTGIGIDELGRTTFSHDIGLVCGDKTVIIKKDINILLMNGLQNMLPCIPANDLFGTDICERTITKITFKHNQVVKAKVYYGQPVINLLLDDGSVISFTHNYGEMPKGDLIPRFSVKR